MDITVLNSTFQPIHIIDSYESMIWTDRYSKCGDFELYTKLSDEVQTYLVPGNYLTINESDRIMIIESIEIDSDIEEGNKFVAKGRSLESILDRRIVWGLKTVTGDVQTCLKTLINEAIISPTDAERAIDDFSFEDSTDTAITEMTMDAQFTGNNLYDVVTQTCATYDIGFKIVLTTSQQGASLNLIKWDRWKTAPVTNGTAVWNDTERSVTLTSTGTDCYTGYLYNTYPIMARIPCEPNTKYTLSWKHSVITRPSGSSDSPVQVHLFDMLEDGTAPEGGVVYTYDENIHNLTLTTTNDDSYLTFRVGITKPGYSIKYYDIQIEKGGSVSPYTPYHSPAQMTFKLFKGTDRSYDQSDNLFVVFSPYFDNISESNYIEDYEPYKNTALIGGEGEGTDRKYQSITGINFGLSRRELFVDARDISSKDGDTTMSTEDYNKLLLQRGEEKLSEVPITKAFDGSADATQMFRYGVDFFIGDKVQLEDSYGNAVASTVTEFIISASDSGYFAYPTFEAMKS